MTLAGAAVVAITAGKEDLVGGNTVTASRPIMDWSQTWNNAGATFTALKLNITNTNSAAGSPLLDLQVGGSSKFQVGLDGSFDAGAGLGAGGGRSYVADLTIISGGTAYARFSGGVGMTLGQSVALGFAAGSPSSGGDAFIRLEASNILAQSNGTAAQTFRVYNTYTDASNYERGVLSWNITGNTLVLTTENAGTGSARNIRIACTNWFIGSDGTFQNPAFVAGTNDAALWSGGSYAWSSTGAPTGTLDTYIVRDAAGIDCRPAQ
jgi:hypothetical protein